jgi:hypothetical protein
MARRSQNAASGALVVLAIVVGVPIYLVKKAGESVGWPVLIGGAIAVVAAIICFRVARAKAAEAERLRQLEQRRQELLRKYGDPQLVEKIMNATVWQGQTAEQLEDSRGPPVDKDQRVFKKSVNETWKYDQRGTNRFALRITLENGLVVGWDDKR